MRRLTTLFFAGLILAAAGTASADYSSWDLQAARLFLETGAQGGVIKDQGEYRDSWSHAASGKKWLSNLASYLRQGASAVKGQDARRLPYVFVQTGRDKLPRTLVKGVGQARIQSDPLQGALVSWKPNQHSMSGVVVGAPASWSKSRTHVMVMTALRRADGRRPVFTLRAVSRAKLRTIAHPAR